MNELQLHRQKQQIMIRKTKISNFFQNNRKILSTLSKIQARQKLIPQLQYLKNIILLEQNQQDLFGCLFSLHQIVKDYDITNFITLRFQYPISSKCRLLSQENRRQLTYLDLVLSLLKESKQLEIMNECAIIIRWCASQISNSIYQKYEVQNYNFYVEIIKRIAKNYPYHLLEHPDSLLVENVVLFLYDAIISCVDGSTIYFLANKLKPGILVYFITILNNSLLMKIQELKEEVVRTALTIVFYINRYNYVQHQLSDYKEIVSLLKEIVKKEIFQPIQPSSFNIYCKFMKILCENRQLKLTKEELLNFQNLMPLYIFDSNQDYLQLLSKLLDAYPYRLSKQNFQLLLSTLFFVTKDATQTVLIAKLQLAIILSKHVINCGNKFHLQDAQMFICFWGQYSKGDRLINLIYELQSLGEKGQKGLDILFSLIVRIFAIKQELQLIGVVLNLSETEISMLLGYQPFQKALEEMEITISFEQN